MNKLIITASLLLLVFNGFAQKIEWGDLQSAGTKRYSPTILGEDNKFIYTIAYVKNDIMLQAFKRKGNNRAYSTEITTEKINGNKVIMEGVVLIGELIVVFESYFDKKKKKAIIQYYMVNSKSGKRKGPKKKIFEVDAEKKRRTSVTLFVSKDRSKLLVNQYGYYKKQKKFRDRYLLFNSDMELIVEKEDVFDKDNLRYATSNYIIDDDGSLYFFKKYQDKAVIVSYDAGNEYEKWEETIDIKKLGLKGKFAINNIRFTINKKDLIVTGFYVKSGKKEGLEGCFFLRIDGKSKEIKTSKISEFDKAFKSSFLTKGQVKRKKEKPVKGNIRFVEVVPKDDGGVVIVGEYYEKIQYTDQNGNVVGERITFGDLVVANLNPEGEMLWSKRVPKKQLFSWGTFLFWPFYAGSYGFSVFGYPHRIPDYFSYMVFIAKGKVNILFNDNPKNTLTNSPNDRVKPLKKLSQSAVNLYSIDLETGKAKKSLFTGAKDFKVYFQPLVMYQEKEGDEVITYGMKGSKFKYGTLKY